MPERRKPQLPENPTIEDLRAYKSAWRAYDAAQLASGEATADEIQRRNSMISTEAMVKAQISFISTVCPDVKGISRSPESARAEG